MAHQFQPRRFLRSAPNEMLERYFKAFGVVANFEWKGLTETQVEPIFEWWLQLPDGVRLEMEKDFRDIDALATEGGSKAILDEAAFHDENLAPQFAALDGFLAHAFWTKLERPRYWPAALAFRHADKVPQAYWRKRKNLPRKPPDVSAEAIAALETGLSGYFHNTQGRGKNCKVECYRRDRLEYFFAYPEDFAQAAVEWEGQTFARRTHHPAFEIIFVLSPDEGTLDLYAPGGSRDVPELQAIFARTILDATLGPDSKDERVYNLDPFRSATFQLKYTADSGITDMVVRKLRLSRRGRNERILLEADPTGNRRAVFDLLERVTSQIPLSEFSITQVGVKVTFARDSSGRGGTRTFDITWPNSVSLKQEGRDLLIRKVLVASGIEPQKPPEAPPVPPPAGSEPGTASDPVADLV